MRAASVKLGATIVAGALRQKAILSSRINVIWVVQSPWPKIFRLTRRANQWLHSPRPVPSEGRFANVTDVRRDAVDAVAALDGRGKSRTAKSCGPDTPTLVSSFAEAIPQATVAKKPGHRSVTGESTK